MSRRYRYDDRSDTFTIIFLAAVVGLLVSVLTRLTSIERVLVKQYEYEAEADMCWQQVENYTARACYVEREGDAYHWYNETVKGE